MSNEQLAISSEELTAADYQKLAMRTASGKCYDLANAALGLAGEAGEVADLIKKHLYHDHRLDAVRVAEELGDLLWYIVLAANICGYSLSEVMAKNIDKLRKRYPEGFDPERSVHRAES